MNANKDFLKSAVTFGLMMAGAFMLIDLFFYVFDFSNMGMMMGLLLFLVFLALYFIFFIAGGRNYRNKYLDGHMKYGKAILFCLLMALVYVLVMFLYQLVFYYLFDPARAANEMLKAAEMIQDNAYIPDDAKEEALKKVMSGSTGSMIIRNLTNNIFMTAIIGAISALFVRKKEKISEVF